MELVVDVMINVDGEKERSEETATSS